MENKLVEICRAFNIDGQCTNIEPIQNGLINSTFAVEFFSDGEYKTYLLQKINTYVFKHPSDVMENIVSVTKHINNKLVSRQAHA